MEHGTAIVRRMTVETVNSHLRTRGNEVRQVAAAETMTAAIWGAGRRVIRHDAVKPRRLADRIHRKATTVRRNSDRVEVAVRHRTTTAERRHVVGGRDCHPSRRRGQVIDPSHRL